MGGTAGRTTMLGEGLQHQDGHSIVLASTVPTCRTYDPAFVYELAVVVSRTASAHVRNAGEECFYYITMYNEDYPQPPMPEAEGVRSRRHRPGHVQAQARPRGQSHRCSSSAPAPSSTRSCAPSPSSQKYKIQADVWSVTSYTEIRREALAANAGTASTPPSPRRKATSRPSSKAPKAPSSRPATT